MDLHLTNVNYEREEREKNHRVVCYCRQRVDFNHKLPVVGSKWTRRIYRTHIIVPGKTSNTSMADSKQPNRDGTDDEQ